MAARPIGVHLPLAPALAMPSSTTSAVKCIACRHSCTHVHTALSITPHACMHTTPLTTLDISNFFSTPTPALI